MGLLVEGRWVERWYETSKGGRFVREGSAFCNSVTRDGSAGPTGSASFRAEAGRYHLYVGYACPWAHRVLIYRSLKGLDEAIGVGAAHWFIGSDGWTFASDEVGIVADKLGDAEFLREIHKRAKSD